MGRVVVGRLLLGGRKVLELNSIDSRLKDLFFWEWMGGAGEYKRTLIFSFEGFSCFELVPLNNPAIKNQIAAVALRAQYTYTKDDKKIYEHIFLSSFI